MQLNRYKVLEYMGKRRIGRQHILAKMVGVSPQALSGWLKGETFTLENLGGLCRALGCTPNDILDLPTVFSPEPRVKRRELQPA